MSGFPPAFGTDAISTTPALESTVAPSGIACPAASSTKSRLPGRRTRILPLTGSPPPTAGTRASAGGRGRGRDGRLLHRDHRRFGGGRGSRLRLTRRGLFVGARVARLVRVGFADARDEALVVRELARVRAIDGRAVHRDRQRVGLPAVVRERGSDQRVAVVVGRGVQAAGRGAVDVPLAAVERPAQLSQLSSVFGPMIDASAVAVCGPPNQKAEPMLRATVAGRR